MSSQTNGSRKPRQMPGDLPRTVDRPPEAAVIPVEAAARRVGVTPQEVLRWVRREGRPLLLREADVAAFVAESRSSRPPARRGSRRAEDPRQLPLPGVSGQRREGT